MDLQCVDVCMLLGCVIICSIYVFHNRMKPSSVDESLRIVQLRCPISPAPRTEPGQVASGAHLSRLSTDRSYAGHPRRRLPAPSVISARVVLNTFAYLIICRLSLLSLDGYNKGDIKLNLQ